MIPVDVGKYRIRVESADVVMRPPNVVRQRAALVTLVVSYTTSSVYAVRLHVGRLVLNEDNNRMGVIDLEQGQVIKPTGMSASEEEFIP